MANRWQVLGLFADADGAVTAIEEMLESPWRLDRVHSPFPHHGILEALKVKKSRVGYFTLVGGIFGFFAGLALSVFTAARWNLIVSGKPVVALISFLIVGFEFTILFSVLGNLLGFLTQARLPDFKPVAAYDPRCSGDRFGIVATCGEGEQEKLKAFFEDKGAESLIFRSGDSTSTDE
jgi:molybdopterin-containing oxidoreductase family membrane subunit